jgi:hypothetical protein
MWHFILCQERDTILKNSDGTPFRQTQYLSCWIKATGLVWAVLSKFAQFWLHPFAPLFSNSNNVSLHFQSNLWAQFCSMLSHVLSLPCVCREWHFIWYVGSLQTDHILSFFQIMFVSIMYLHFFRIAFCQSLDNEAMVEIWFTGLSLSLHALV